MSVHIRRRRPTDLDESYRRAHRGWYPMSDPHVSLHASRTQGSSSGSTPQAKETPAQPALEAEKHRDKGQPHSLDRCRAPARHEQLHE